MISERLVIELRAVLQAQNHILHQLNAAVSDAEEKLADVSEHTEQIRELEQLMTELEESADWLKEDDFSDFDPDELLQLYQRRRSAVSHELVKIGFKDWDSFVRQCQIYSLHQSLDPLAPYEAMLTEADLRKLEDESYDAQLQWDKWDYIFVGASGVLASLTDHLLVRIPQTLTTGEYAGQIGSPLTAWLKQYDTNKANDWFAQLAKHLSKTKVPYDEQKSFNLEGEQEKIPGMGGKSHRFQSFGHDPVLGFIFGVFDIMQGTLTGFSYDDKTHSWTHEGVKLDYEPVGLIEAILRHVGHLISDIATPMGLPAPFMTLIQGINVGSFGKKGRTVGEIARWMYLNGYDFRHFLVSGITPAVIEITLRAYIMLRHYSEHGETKFSIDSHPKYRSMLLVAHLIATLGNAGKFVLMQNNPLAISWAEWLAFFRYLFPTIKYWIFDQNRLRLEHIEQLNETGSDELLQNSEKILEIVTKNEYQIVTLGRLPSSS